MTIAMPRDGEIYDAVILADGSYPSAGMAAGILSAAARVVCCDGSVREFSARGGMPYAVVGDCDSLGSELRERFAGILHCDSDQYSNDLTKAVAFCRARGMRRLAILGATGKREDHTLGNISLLADYSEYADVSMVTDHGVFNPIRCGSTFGSFPGQQVSIFTFTPQTLITTGNLLYPLCDAPLAGWWQGTLNESMGDDFSIGTTGPAVVFRAFRQ